MIAAINAGADAVYLGGKNFNARGYADNFTIEELKEAVNFAHMRDVKLYVTLNTLIKDEEIEEVIRYIGQLYSIGIDALIVQDIGIISLVRRYYPDFEIHFSTQGAVYSLDGVKEATKMGCKRVVLAREVSIEEMKYITENTNTEIEVFVHGALCMSYSGICQMSRAYGERSGNRGQCAQPCRLPYELYDGETKLIDKKYLLSPKDIMGLRELPELVNSGVASLKIEGRMKSPEYVAVVISTYRKYLDKIANNEEYIIDESDIHNLEQAFNRGGFSNGYLKEKNPSELICSERSKHWGTYLGEVIDYNYKKKLVKIRLDNDLTMGDGVEIVNDTLPGNIVTLIKKNGEQVDKAYKGDIVFIGDIKGYISEGDKIYKITDKELNKEMKYYFDGRNNKRVRIDGKFMAKLGENPVLELWDNRDNKVSVTSDFVVEKAINRPILKEKVLENLSKMGDTPFYLEECEIILDDEVIIPISVINSIRREATALLEQKRGQEISRNSNIEFERRTIRSNINAPKISVYLYNLDNLEGLEKVDRLYIPLKEAINNKEKLQNINKEIFVALPQVTKENYKKMIEDNKEIFEMVDGICIANIEHIELVKEFNKPIWADYSLNIYNSYSLDVLKELGVQGADLSHELIQREIVDMDMGIIETEVCGYGSIPIMHTEYCIISGEITNKLKCGYCKNKKLYLKDKLDVKLPLILDDTECRTTVLSKPKQLNEYSIRTIKNKGVDYIKVYFYDEDTQDRRRIINLFK